MDLSARDRRDGFDFHMGHRISCITFKLYHTTFANYPRSKQVYEKTEDAQMMSDAINRVRTKCYTSYGAGFSPDCSSPTLFPSPGSDTVHGTPQSMGDDEWSRLRVSPCDLGGSNLPGNANIRMPRTPLPTYRLIRS